MGVLMQRCRTSQASPAKTHPRVNTAMPNKAMQPDAKRGRGSSPTR